MKVVSWEATEEQVMEEPGVFLVTAFLLHGGERCSATSGVIDAACARTLVGSRWFEGFEVELKRSESPVEVVPDNETFRLGLGPVKQFSRAVIFQLLWGRPISY